MSTINYFNRDLEIFKVNEESMTCLNENESHTSRVLCDGQIILKQYSADPWFRNNKIKLDIFDRLRSIDNKHLMKLLEIYSFYNNMNVSKYEDTGQFNICAYTARYYEPDLTNILLESKDYLLENIDGIDKLFEQISSMGILVKDVIPRNTIVNSSGIVIIDPDFYSISHSTKEEIICANKNQLVNLIRKLVYYYAGLLNINNKYYDIGKLFDIYVSKETKVAKEVSKKLRKVKKPIDYL